jgi:TrmH family RNA methyltransferase
MITSHSNARVKFLRKLHTRKERQKTGLFYLEGIRIVAEAIQQRRGLQEIVIAPELLNSEFALQLVNDEQTNGVQVLEVSADVFLSISGKEHPQGIAAVCKQRWESLENIYPKNGDLWIALDSVQDPGNLGTILRTADAVGACGLILLDQSTDPYDPTAIRASMGAIFSQHLVQTDFDVFLSWTKKVGISVIGTSGASATDYQSIAYSSPLVLLMGSEREGLQSFHLEVCDEVVRIPMVGNSDSLNLSIATGVVLYEIFNQWRKKK